VLRAPLRERPERLPLEVDHEELAAVRAEHLAEVVVAVVADAEPRVVAHRVDRRGGAGDEGVAPRHQVRGLVGERGR
jgi:hypothetical protein